MFSSYMWQCEVSVWYPCYLHSVFYGM